MPFDVDAAMLRMLRPRRRALVPRLLLWLQARRRPVIVPRTPLEAQPPIRPMRPMRAPRGMVYPGRKSRIQALKELTE